MVKLYLQKKYFHMKELNNQWKKTILSDELLADDISDIESEDGDLLDTVAKESEQQLNAESEKPSQEETQSQNQTDELKNTEVFILSSFKIGICSYEL